VGTITGKGIIEGRGTIERKYFIVPFENEALAFLDVFNLLDQGYQNNDPIEVWNNFLGDPDGNAVQLTLASQPTFLTNANSTGIPGVLFDGLTTQHFELNDAWKVPKQGPWTMYFALRRNSTFTRAIATWSNAAANNNIAYGILHVSAARTNYNLNNVFSGNILLHVLSDSFYSHITNQRRVISVTKREDNGYTVHIDNLLLFQTDADGTITTPTVSPLLGARWDSTGLAKELFLHSTMMGALLYETAHDNTKRNRLFDFLFDRYAITPPHVENRNTSILNVLGADAKGHWVNADTTTTCTDLSAYGKNGTYQNGVTLGEPPLARFGESALFTASSNQYVSDIGVVGDYDFMRNTNVWTYGVWIRPVANITHNQVLLSTTSGNDDVGVIIGIDKSGINRQLRVDLTGPAGQQQLNIRSQVQIWTNNQLSFLVVVSTGTHITFYRNGQFWVQVAITAGTSDDSHAQALSLAGPPVGDAPGYYNGAMQLAFLSNRALTQPEIIDIYASTRQEFD
jgi:hypothetical protein